MKKQTGFTLIEMMIALVLGLIVLGATINIYIATVGSSSNLIKSARLNHDLESVMTLMLNDIKRAGYWGGANFAADSRANPFTTATTNIQIPVNTCVLYSYDADGLGTVDSNEFYGFKFTNNSIQMRKTGTTTASTDCSDGTWEEFIDGNQLTITNLQFNFVPVTGVLPATSRCLNVTNNSTAANAPTPPAAPQVICSAIPTTFPIVSGDNLAEKRLVNIQLTGHVTSDTTVTKTLNGTVEVRNNRLYIKP
ncbi:MAG TPA: prepilin-type N-terminal cleavage/methylation domain-containing protein [Methylobacter sp.]